MAYEPLHHKYRPQTFADLVGQEAIAQTLTNAILQSRIAPAYLFSGPRGTGKTSSARILAKSLNCQAGENPTPTPCGVCEACRSIVLGSALDVIEIDAASNTGVDNIRELIEKAQFAPVQCRFKVYVIDECLTGDTLVQTEDGLMRIDDPSIQGKRVLSYNEASEEWEYKPVVRWLDQGDRQTYIIKTTHRTIQCTGNHLIRTKQGWVEAKDVKEKTKILSPVSTKSTLAQAWTTNFEVVKSIERSTVKAVYDIEVEDNHNFVANGLLVHNCHMLSTAAFNALLKTLEEPPDRVVFVLATTDPQRVLPTIISRCQRFDYRRIPLESMVSHLQLIAEKEQIEIEAEALTLVAQLAQGGLRDAESLLDQLSLLPPPIAVEAVWDLVGAVPERELLSLVEAIATNNPELVIDRARNLMNRGREPLIVLQNLASFYRDLLIAKTAPQRNDLVAITPSTWEQIADFVQKLDVSALLQGQQHLRSSEVQLKNTTQPRLWLEVTLMGLLPGAIATSGIPLSGTAPTPLAVMLPPTPPKTVPPPPAPPASIQQASAPVPAPAPAPPQASAPTASIPPATPAPSTPSPTPRLDLGEFWRQVLIALKLPGTQTLLRQQARLQSYDGKTAKVHIPTQWMNTLQGKLPAIEAAFAQAAGGPVKVKFEAIATASPQAPPAHPTPAPATVLRPSPAPQPPPPSTPAPQPSAKPSAAPEPPVLPPQDSRPSPPEPVSSSPEPAPPPPAATNHQAPAAKLASLPSYTELSSQRIDSWDEGELLRAAKSLAQFFNGEVVQDEGPSETNGSAASLPIETSPASASLEPVEEEEDDDDVPF